jgi:hypothetical protein
MTDRGLVLLLIIPLAACTVAREESVAGTYVLEAPCVTATLLVRRDHSFTQIVRTGPGEVNRLTGEWSFDREGFVYLRPILSLQETPLGTKIGGLTGKVEWSLDGRRIGPEIVKCADSSHEENYFRSP